MSVISRLESECARILSRLRRLEEMPVPLAPSREKVAGMGLAYLPVIEILKLQPWWPGLCAGVSGLRHLKLLDYIKLSERSSETAHI
jgi:hypothetical protein